MEASTKKLESTSRHVLGNEGMGHLIGIVNKLQDAFTSLNLPLTLNLPQIAVVGCQSAGKSSVLENIVGRDFLPRGSGIVTRRPLVLQLIQSETEFAEFLHLPDQRFTDFSEVRREIERETDRLLGQKKTVSSVPINLHIYSPNVLNLTLIDLPGLTKNPIADQPRDISDQIRRMVFEYIAKENCLILAVSPANIDLANSDGIQIAREVDPEGQRTIGVLTKLDLMEEGTNARKILENKEVPLRRGYVGVVNRGQREINQSVGLTIEAERRFFEANYPDLVDRNGTLYLQKTLNQQLTEHIRRCLPGLRADLASKLENMEKEVAEAKKDADEVGRRRRMNNLILDFTNEFRSALYGAGEDVSDDKLNTGARIKRIFHQKFPDDLAQLNQDMRVLYKEISLSIWNNEAIRPSLFTPYAAFEGTVKNQISRVLQPAYRCVDLVLVEIRSEVFKCAENLQKWPVLQEVCEQVSTAKLKECEKACKHQIKVFVDMQLAYINTYHKDFAGLIEPANNQQQQQQADNPTYVVPPRPTSVNVELAKGGLFLHNVGFLKERRDCWFVLTTETLTCYGNERGENKRFSVPVNRLKYSDYDRGKGSFGFVIQSIDGRSVHTDFKILEVSCQTLDIKEYWKQNFARAGVQIARQEQPSSSASRQQDPGSTDTTVDESMSDPIHQRRVEKIAKCVESYVSIVHTATLDMVPKAIMLMVIQDLRKFFETDFQSDLNDSEADLMEETAETVAHRQHLLKVYEASEKALSLINDFMARGVALPSSGTPSSRRRETSQMLNGGSPKLSGSQSRSSLQSAAVRKPK